MSQNYPRLASIQEESLVKTSVLVRGISIIMLLFIIPLEGLLESRLISWGKHVVYDFQQDRTDNGKMFFTIVSYLGGDWTLIFICPAIYHFYDARRGIKLILMINFTMYVTSFLSLLYREPRPYWEDKDIKGVLCLSGFANPSYQVMLGTVIYVSIAIEIFHRSRFRIIAYGIVVIIATMISIGGVYLGEIFPHQILITLCYCFIYVTVAFAFDKTMMDLSLKSSFNYKTNRTYIVFWFIGTMMLFLGVIGVFQIVTLNSTVNLKWIRNATKHCSLNYDVSGAYSFYHSAWIFYNFGLVTGAMISSKKITMFWGYTKIWKKVIRFLITAGLSVGIKLLFNQINTTEVVTEYIWKHALPLFLMSFLYAGLLPRFFAKLQLLVSLDPTIDEENELKSIHENEMKLI
ncbi:unnamed protein product [Blepharisma stoltei]|uniref:Phosphatidic acid phosphatase type 2/haloperoxidase domain-containing protein n=1 Tax=Blepharisma stoltei TaxID=1481888 RepID=A0AAU9JQ88_9CILI|nr:unnamed protein product [Blepharisma stoltei]